MAPALAMRPSSRPVWETMFSRAALTDSSEVTSVWMNEKRFGFLVASSLKGSEGVEMSRLKTWRALLARQTSARPRPIPWFAPVTVLLVFWLATEGRIGWLTGNDLPRQRNLPVVVGAGEGAQVGHGLFRAVGVSVGSHFAGMLYRV